MLKLGRRSRSPRQPARPKLVSPLPRGAGLKVTALLGKPTRLSPFIIRVRSGSWRSASTTLRSSSRKSPASAWIATSAMQLGAVRRRSASASPRSRRPVGPDALDHVVAVPPPRARSPHLSGAADAAVIHDFAAGCRADRVAASPGARQPEQRHRNSSAIPIGTAERRLARRDDQLERGRCLRGAHSARLIAQIVRLVERRQHDDDPRIRRLRRTAPPGRPAQRWAPTSLRCFMLLATPHHGAIDP